MKSLKPLTRFVIVITIITVCFVVVSIQSAPIAVVQFKIDPAASKFIAHGQRGGLLYFKGHSHRLAVDDFDGTAELDLSAVNPASLHMTVRSASIEETDPFFTPEQKKIIKKELDEIVFESSKYPEITFQSTDVKATPTQGKFDVQIGGNLTLHGVTKRVVIPATVSVDGDTLHAIGEFKIDRKDFNVKATTAAHGLVRVQHDVKFDFDIVAKRV